MVNDFADLSLQGVPQNNGRPSGDYPSVDAVINKVIIVTGFSLVDTENGQRVLVNFMWHEGEAETAFFTSSKRLLSVLRDPKIQFPFATIIKVIIVRAGMASFEFRSAKEAVSEQDVQNFTLYQLQKRSYLKNRNK
ncbi:MAG: hypothetical protein NC548_56890 [Lachnospiraceae bacterium]|nr:hypothetical protein [Lachnospiraceae bacterium]